MNALTICLLSTDQEFDATALVAKRLQEQGYEVYSQVLMERTVLLPNNVWQHTKEGYAHFNYYCDTAMHSDCCVYIGGDIKRDGSAAVGVGMALANGTPVFGLDYSGRDLGLMNKACVKWARTLQELVEDIQQFELNGKYLKA